MRRTLAIAALAALPLVACGGDDDAEGGADPGSGNASGSGSASGPESTEGAGGGETITVGALDALAFDSDSYRAAAGEITFVYENEGSLPHTLVIDGVDAEEFKLAVGDTDEGSVELEPGEYTLFCDVPGHRDGGMEATLTVE